MEPNNAAISENELAEALAVKARLEESRFDTDSDASDCETESEEDDYDENELPRLGSAFHNMRISRVATFRHFRCCPSCAEEELSEYVDANEDSWDGWVFFTIADTSAAIKCGWLTLRFGSNSIEYDIGRRIADGLWNMGVRLDWDGDDDTPIDIKLTKGDMDVMLSLEAADNWQKAKKHYRKQMLKAFRIGVFKQKVARRVVGNAMMEWAARPGGASARVKSKQWQKKYGQISRNM